MSESHGGRQGDQAWPFGPTGGTTPPSGAPGPATTPVPAWAAASGDAAGATAPAGGTPHDDAVEPSGGRRRALLVGGIVVGVLAVGGIGYGVVNALGSGGTPSAATSTVQLPSPTPTVDPIDRGEGSAFFTALPDSVLRFALASTGPADSWSAAGAIEAYTFTYSDGADGEVVVVAGQWETPPEATAFADGLLPEEPPAEAPAEAPTEDATDGATAEPPPSVDDTGDVQVDGETVGTYTIRDLGDGTGVAFWQNGTTVFQATGPVADITDFYAAFPL